MFIRNQGKLDWLTLATKRFGIDRVFGDVVGGVRQYVHDLAVAIQVGISDGLRIAADVKNAQDIMLIPGEPRCKQVIGDYHPSLNCGSSDFLVRELCPRRIKLRTPLISAWDSLCDTRRDWPSCHCQQKQHIREPDVHDASEYNNNVLLDLALWT